MRQLGSHLAMRGVPPLSIKELAGHRSLRTTMRYMHLGKGEKHRAIQRLEEGRESLRRGDILETSRGLKAPGPETAEIPAASGPSFSVPDGIRTRVTGLKGQPLSRVSDRRIKCRLAPPWRHPDARLHTF
jgi:hypothetical protein